MRALTGWVVMALTLWGEAAQQWFQVWGGHSGIVSIELHQVRTASVKAKNFFGAQDVAVVAMAKVAGSSCFFFFFSPC